jgi:PAS domain S-box-containing protein
VPSNLHKQRVAARRRALFQAAPGLAALARLFEGDPAAVFCIKDPAGCYLDVNQAFLRRARLATPDQLLGRTAREVFPALLAAGYEQQDAAVLRGGREVRDELELVTNPDGSLGWYLARKVPVRDAAGRVIALAGVSRDLRAGERDPRIRQLARAVEILQRDLAGPVRIAALAASLGLSLSRLERLARAVLGIAPRQLLTRLRVERAAHELTSTRKPLAAVAVDGGFCDQPTFCRQFKAVTGLSPGAFRRRDAGLHGTTGGRSQGKRGARAARRGRPRAMITGDVRRAPSSAGPPRTRRADRG